MAIEAFFERLWKSYTEVAPGAQRIHDAFVARGEEVVNDHVAFRTLALDPIGIAKLEPHLLALGYRRHQTYDFPVKKLSAVGYVGAEPHWPRIFLSELRVHELSDAAGTILNQCASHIDRRRCETDEVLEAGVLWPEITWEQYETLQRESEYAAWFAAIGIRPNHFTINVNALKNFQDVASVLDFVESLGFAINESGGRIKGTPEQLLVQGSTMADRIAVKFADDQQIVPSCYYEFAQRYNDPEGNLFQGFVAASADRIFESTSARGAKKN